MSILNYPILIQKEPRSDYGVIVPDLPGCFSAGRTIDEALAMARERASEEADAAAFTEDDIVALDCY